ncbi:hypothetical protein IVU49_18410 [Salmonella enterica subsp. enterica serovar Worthington]|nr:hypothetical protein [Salmonella enterica subsp. enterica serovar Worthington]
MLPRRRRGNASFYSLPDHHLHPVRRYAVCRETGNTVATDTATSAAIVGDNSNDWDLLIESGAVVGSSLTDSRAMNPDSSTGATSVHNRGRSPVPTKMER